MGHILFKKIKNSDCFWRSKQAALHILKADFGQEKAIGEKYPSELSHLSCDETFLSC